MLHLRLGSSLLQEWIGNMSGPGPVENPWRRAWQPTPVFLPGLGSLESYKFPNVAEEQEAGELAGERSVRNEVLFLSFPMDLTF